MMARSATAPEFAAGRSDRLFFIRTTGTALQFVSVPTGTQNATPTVIASGNTGGPLDFGYSPDLFYADDSLLGGMPRESRVLKKKSRIAMMIHPSDRPRAFDGRGQGNFQVIPENLCPLNSRQGWTIRT